MRQSLHGQLGKKPLELHHHDEYQYQYTEHGDGTYMFYNTINEV